MVRWPVATLRPHGQISIKNVNIASNFAKILPFLILWPLRPSYDNVLFVLYWLVWCYWATRKGAVQLSWAVEQLYRQTYRPSVTDANFWAFFHHCVGRRPSDDDNPYVLFFRADSHWDVWKESIKLSQAVWPLWRFLWKLAVSQPKIGQNRPKLAILENQCFSLNLTVILILHSKIGGIRTDISREISKMAKQGTPIYPHFLFFWPNFVFFD